MAKSGLVFPITNGAVNCRRKQRFSVSRKAICFPRTLYCRQIRNMYAQVVKCMPRKKPETKALPCLAGAATQATKALESVTRRGTSH